MKKNTPFFFGAIMSIGASLRGSFSPAMSVAARSSRGVSTRYTVAPNGMNDM
jgi:hypothetical protein